MSFYLPFEFILSTDAVLHPRRVHGSTIYWAQYNVKRFLKNNFILVTVFLIWYNGDEVIEMGTSATRAKDKYNSKSYDEVKIRVNKGGRDEIDAAAERAGMSRNAFILEAIAEKMGREK